MHPSLILSALLLAGTGAHGQTVYRCGNSYSQVPCAGGTTLSLQESRPTPAEAAKAASVAAADQKRADAMEKARLAQEKNAPKALIIGAQAQAPASAPVPVVKTSAKADTKTGKKKGKQPEHFTAVAPKAPGEKKK